VMGAESGVLLCAIIRVNYKDRDNTVLRNFAPDARVKAVNIYIYIYIYVCVCVCVCVCTITFWQSILQV
jgi:hypothetical protein